MAEIAFTIDPETGELTLHVGGVAGPACDDVAKLARELLGAPAREEETAEYRVRPTAQLRVRFGARGGERR